MKKQAKRTQAHTLFAAAAFAALAAAPSLHAVTYAEAGDAGQTLASAQFTAASPAAGGQNLTALSGILAGTDGLDADLYAFTITSTGTFSATATGGTSSAGNFPIDTSLFLFNASGVPILANDDNASGTSYQGVLPAGNSLLTTLSAGTYYLGISLSGNEPANLNNQQLFTTDNPTNTVRGIAAGLNPTTLGIFNGQTFVPEGGTYSIALSGAATLAAVPEPSTWALLALGTGALTLLRRRQTANA